MNADISNNGVDALFLLSASKQLTYFETQMHPVVTTEYTIYFIHKGSGHFHIAEDAYTFQDGDVFFVEPNTFRQIRPSSAELKCFVLTIDILTYGKQDNTWSRDDSLCPNLPFTTGKLNLDGGEKLHRKVLNLHDLAKHHPEPTYMYKHLHLQEVIEVLKEEVKTRKAIEEHNGLDLTIYYMHNHLGEKIALAELARIASLSINAYSRKFKQKIGVSPMVYLRNLRTEKAKDRIKHNLPFKEIATTLGFGNEFYFSRTFKQTVGIPPAVYRKESEMRIALVTFLDFNDHLKVLNMKPIVTCSLFQFSGVRNKELEQKQLNYINNLKPDLIITDFFHHDFKENLEQIAPTLTLNYQEDWRIHQKKIAEVTSKEHKIADIFEQLEEKAYRAKQSILNRREQTIPTILYLQQDKIRMQGAVKHPLSHLLYNELSMEPAQFISVDSHRSDFVPEKIHHLPQKGDLFIHLWDKENISTYWDTFTSHTKNSQIHYISDWLSMSWTSSGRSQIIDELLSLLNH